MPAKPLLLFDADCGFCRRWIGRWQHETRDHVEYASYQSCSERFPQIPRENFARAVHLIEPDGSHAVGAEAVFGALAHGGRRWPLALYQRLPLFAPVTEALYRFVAGHRRAAGAVTQCLWGSYVVPPGV